MIHMNAVVGLPTAPLNLNALADPLTEPVGTNNE